MNNRINTSSRDGFSLIEILISILILSLGLLGLGALFPVVIREQRNGTDAINGVIVSNAARATMGAANWANALPDESGQPHPARGTTDPTAFLWDRMRYSAGSPGGPGSVRSNVQVNRGLAEGYRRRNNDTDAPTTGMLARNQEYAFGEWLGEELIELDTGKLALGHFDPAGVQYAGTPGTVRGYVDLPVAARLLPSGPGVRPIYVWDAAFQRVPGKRTLSSGQLVAEPFDDGVRAAIFVRRIDPRIKTPDDIGYAESLSGFSRVDGNALAPEQRRLPVGETNDGVPTLDGTDGSGGLRYSAIQTIAVRFDFDDSNPGVAVTYGYRDRLYFSTTSGLTAQELQRAYAFLRQPGQKIVDNLGNIYTVVGSGSQQNASGANADGNPDPDYLKVDPPVPESVTIDDTSLRATNQDRIAIRQIAYTRQPPVSITLVDLLRGGRQ